VKSSVRVFFLFLVIFLATMGGHLYSPDEEILFRTTQSLAEHGRFSIEPLQGFATRKGIDGVEYAQYGIGQPILAVPFYYFGKALYKIFPFQNAPFWVEDTTQYYDIAPEPVVLRLGVSLFNQVVTALLCAVLFSFCHYLTRDLKAAWMTCLLFGVGSYAWVHSKPFFTEPLAALLSFSSFYLLYKGLEKSSLSRILLGGILYAYALLVRLDSLFLIPGYFVLIFLSNGRFTGYKFSRLIRAQFRSPGEIDPEDPMFSAGLSEEERKIAKSPLRHYLFFAPLALSFLILLALNKSRYGSFMSTGYEDQEEGLRFSTPLLAGFYGFIFSAGKGMFFFSPPLALFFFAARKFYKKYFALALGLFALALSFFVVQCKWQNWPGGWCWGPRHIYQIHVFLALPISILFLAPRSVGKRCVFWAFLLVGAFIQIYGSSQNFIDYYAEFFTTPRTPPNNNNVWYRESEPFLDNAYALFILDEKGQMLNRVPLHTLVSPIQNSIYYPQNSVWSNYFVLLRLGRHDFFWPRLVCRRSSRQSGSVPQGSGNVPRDNGKNVQEPRRTPPQKSIDSQIP